MTETASPPVAEGPVRFSDAARKRLDAILARYPERRPALLPVLHLAQEEFGWISDAAIEHVAEVLDLPPAHVYDTVSFYTLYHRRPPARVTLRVCASLSCAMAGGLETVRRMREGVGTEGSEPSADGAFAIEKVECLAACDQAPCLLAGERLVGGATPDRIPVILEALRGDREPPGAVDPERTENTLNDKKSES